MVKPKMGKPPAPTAPAHASIYRLSPTGPDQVALELLTDAATLTPGATRVVTFGLGQRTVLVVYDKATDQAEASVLTRTKPWLAATSSHLELTGGPWDLMDTFVLGNEQHLLTYRADTGTFGVFRINAKLQVSPPYTFRFPRNWPTGGFTAMGAFQSLGGQYVLGYASKDGKVGIYSLTAAARSIGGAPPLVGLPTWTHDWAAGWTHFVFFPLGGATYFFKINTRKLNVNIDHVQDNPSAGTVEVGSGLQAKLPEALEITAAVNVPWRTAEPRLATYVEKTGHAVVYRVHADCQGWTALGDAHVPGASQIVSYEIGGASYLLFYRS